MTSVDEKTFCQNCSQYIESSKFFLHERMCSLNVKKCPKCDKPFNLDDLDEHIKLEHSFEVCDLCNGKFKKNEIEKHKINCDYRLISCKYCELNVIFLELEEHENICGSTTQKCEKCGLLIEKKLFNNHICQKQESELLSEHIKIDKTEEEKIEKKKIKNKNNKKNKKQKYNKDNEIDFNFINKPEDIDMDMNFTPKEINSQIKALNKFEKKKEMENQNKNVEDKKEKKKNKKKKEKEKEKEDEKEEEIKIKYKKKKGKKNKAMQNNKNTKCDELSDEDDYYPAHKKMNLHNIKFDLPPDEYQNYNKNKKFYSNEYNNYILEEKMVMEAIKQSLLDD